MSGQIKKENVNKKVLVVDLEYYNENANTLIIKRMCNCLAKEYEVTMVTYCPAGARHINSSAFSIIQIPYYSLNKALNSGDYKLIKQLKLYYYAIKARLLKDNIEEKNAVFFFHELIDNFDVTQFDIIVSFSNPFSSHYAAMLLSSKFNIPWIAYYFDPFFTNATFDKVLTEKRREREEYILSKAHKILMTYPTNVDYYEHNIQFKGRIIQTEMPGIRTDWNIEGKDSMMGHYQCYFIGNLYKDIRNPQATIELFSGLKENMELFFVGGYYGQKMDTDELHKNIHFIGKKSSAELQKIYKEADFLVNIGNTIVNQMPSKIFEYISTGKPIINIYKKKNCPTLKYLNQYQLAINIYEEDIKNDAAGIRSKLLKFCNTHIGQKVSLADVSEIFSSNVDENVSKLLANNISATIEERGIQ